MSATQEYETYRALVRTQSRKATEYYRTLDSRRASIHEKQYARQQLDQQLAERFAVLDKLRRLKFLVEAEAVPLASAILATIRAYPDAEPALVARALEIVKESLKAKEEAPEVLS